MKWSIINNNCYKTNKKSLQKKEAELLLYKNSLRIVRDHCAMEQES